MLSNHHDHEQNSDPVHGHAYAVSADQTMNGGRKGLLIALSITLLMMIAEIIGGLLSNSLALLSDAGHMLTDNLALILSFFAMKFATMPATDKKTFGFYRLEILAALINGVILVLLSLYIMYQAYLRMINPLPVEGGLMFAIAVIGLIVNIIGAFFLVKHRNDNLNLRGAFLHIVGDALSSVGVIIGGGIIIATGWYLIDPILSILISLVIIYGSWRLVTESVNILLESVPSHIEIEQITEAITNMDGVREAYHIHVWTLTSGVYALSAHVLVDDQLVSNSRELLNAIREMLDHRFHIMHSTIQLECQRCESGLVCGLPESNRKHHVMS